MGGILSILVVDDNPSVANTLADILEVNGYEVHVAYSGPEALEILRGNSIDVLLTDVKMPDMNGFELYREAKKIHPTLPTILMTAYAEDNLIQQGMREGIKTVLTKPLDIDFLLSLFSAIERSM